MTRKRKEGAPAQPATPARSFPAGSCVLCTCRTEKPAKKYQGIIESVNTKVRDGVVITSYYVKFPPQTFDKQPTAEVLPWITGDIELLSAPTKGAKAADTRSKLKPKLVPASAFIALVLCHIVAGGSQSIGSSPYCPNEGCSQCSQTAKRASACSLW